MKLLVQASNERPQVFRDKHPPKPITRPQDIPGWKPPARRPQGLGDRVEKVAQPIAKVIDRVAGTNVQGCGACKKRKEKLNRMFPGK